MSNEHHHRETLNPIGGTGRVSQVYSLPSDRVMDRDVILDGAKSPRPFPLFARAQFDQKTDE